MNCITASTSDEETLIARAGNQDSYEYLVGDDRTVIIYIYLARAETVYVRHVLLFTSYYRVFTSHCVFTISPDNSLSENESETLV